METVHEGQIAKEKEKQGERIKYKDIFYVIMQFK